MNIELAKKVAACPYSAPEQVAGAQEYIRREEGYAAPEDVGTATDMVMDAAYEAACRSLRARILNVRLAEMTRKALLATLP